jgi:hypothetical protein
VAARRRNTQPGNPRKGRAYRVVPAKGGTRHVYAGGPSLFVPTKTPAARKKAAPKPKPPAKPNPLYQPTRVLSGTALRNAANQIADADLNPQIAALNKQSKTSATQGVGLMNRADAYYRQLAAREQQNVAAQSALGARLTQDTRQVGGEAGAAYTALLDRVNAAQSQDAALRGPGLGGDSNQSIQDQLATTQRITGAQQAAGERAAVAQGADWASLTNAMSGATGMRGAELENQLVNRTLNNQDKLSAQVAALEATRGGQRMKSLTGLRQQQFENQTILSGLGIKQADLQVQAQGITQRARDAAASRTSAEKRARISANAALQRARIAARSANRRADAQIRAQAKLLGRKLSQQEKASIRTAETSRANKALEVATSTANNIRTTTTSAANNQRTVAARKRAATQKKVKNQTETIQNTLGLMSPTTARKQILDKNGKPTGRTRPASQAETVQFLRGKKTPEWAIQAGLSIRHHGFIIPSVQRQMRAAGVVVPKQYRTKPRRPLANYSGYTGLPSIVGHG